MAKKDVPSESVGLPAPAPGFVRVELLAGMSGARFNFVPGQVLDVREHIRDRWIDHGAARDYQPALVDVQVYDDEADNRPDELPTDPPPAIVDPTMDRAGETEPV